MKNIITIIACSLLLLGCSKSQTQQHNSNIGFTAGSSRDAIVKQLSEIHAKVLKDSPELLHAEFTAPELKRPMQVDLAFDDGKLTSVNYIPQ
jgi:major membrane immunogen (membrane-anchored lipoprotein)